MDNNSSFINLRLAGEVRAIRLVVFDCDGVLLDTMAAKIEAFRRWVCARWPQHEAVFLDHVMGSFGRSRNFQIEWFFNHCLDLAVDAEALADEVALFTAICEPLCADAGWLTGSSEFVAACEAAGVPRYVLSGTPQRQLEDMLVANGVDQRFSGIIGSPPTKSVSLQKILAMTGIAPDATVFVGDAEADAQAAASVGIHFVYKPSVAKRPLTPIQTEATDLRELLV
jgi:phosphoglycolate phosphatase